MTYYKVLVNGRSCHGGDCEYALPTQREDGTWEPGEWMPEIEEPLVLCARGYHLTREPALWWREGAECYVAEWDGERVADDEGGDKIAVRRCRLLRRLTAAELAALRVFVEGSHQVSDGVASASGSAQVEARGSAMVEAHGSAQVRAYDLARVKAYDSAQIRASDSTRVRASGSARVEAFDEATVDAYDFAWIRARGSARIRVSGYVQVWAYGSATVNAHGSARVRSFDFARVKASGSAQVDAYGSATVDAYDLAQVSASESALVRTPRSARGQPTVMTSDAAVWVDYRSGMPVVHTAEGRLEPVASGG